MSIKGWMCETCKRFSSAQPWCCPTCREEVCDRCFDTYAHCKSCSRKFTVTQLIHAANSQGFDFDSPDSPQTQPTNSAISAGGDAACVLDTKGGE